MRVYVSGQFLHILQPSSAHITTSIMGKTGKKNKTTGRKKKEMNVAKRNDDTEDVTQYQPLEDGNYQPSTDGVPAHQRNSIRRLHSLEWIRSRAGSHCYQVERYLLARRS
jgi:hypothetical protein